MKKIFINKNWKFFNKKNDIFLFNILTSKQLKISNDIDACLFVLNSVKKGINEKELYLQFEKNFSFLKKKWLNESLKLLNHWGVIGQDRKKPTDLTNGYLNGLDRQLDFLEEIFPTEGKYTKQLQLKNSKIAILGLGTIAQYIILALEASGIGNFKCIDFDLVEERNIGRQPILRVDDIGKYKTDVIGKFLTRSRDDIKVKTVNIMIKNIDDVKKIIKGYDIVLHCCDYPRFLIHRWINEACLELNMPNLLIYSGRVGPFSFPYNTSCYGCMESFLKKHVKAYDELTKDITEEGMGRYPELAVVGAITGSLAAKEVVSYILGIEIETSNHFFDISPRDIKIIKHPLPRQKNCHACGKRKQ